MKINCLFPFVCRGYIFFSFFQIYILEIQKRIPIVLKSNKQVKEANFMYFLLQAGVYRKKRENVLKKKMFRKYIGLIIIMIIMVMCVCVCVRFIKI